MSVLIFTLKNDFFANNRIFINSKKKLRLVHNSVIDKINQVHKLMISLKRTSENINRLKSKYFYITLVIFRFQSMIITHKNR